MKLADFFSGRPKKQRTKIWTPTNHQPDTEYLRDVVQIPDEAARELAHGDQLSAAMERACDLTIEVAREQIKRVAPVRCGVRPPTKVRLSARRWLKGMTE